MGITAYMYSLVIVLFCLCVPVCEERGRKRKRSFATLFDQLTFFFYCDSKSSSSVNFYDGTFIFSTGNNVQLLSQAENWPS